MERKHRWSGWPGAYCLDCGAEDQFEICIWEHTVALICEKGHWHCLEHPTPPCPDHVNGPCPGKPENG